MSDIKFEIIKSIAVLSESSNGWRREVNIVSWNERKPKLDIRDWDPEHKKMGKGITLNEEEAQELKKVLMENDLDDFQNL